jgi:hypothetical protein
MGHTDNRYGKSSEEKEEREQRASLFLFQKFLSGASPNNPAGLSRAI